MKLLSVFMMLWIILIVRNHNLSSMSANYLDINEDGHFGLLFLSVFCSSELRQHSIKRRHAICVLVVQRAVSDSNSKK